MKLPKLKLYRDLRYGMIVNLTAVTEDKLTSYLDSTTPKWMSKSMICLNKGEESWSELLFLLGGAVDHLPRLSAARGILGVSVLRCSWKQ